MGYCPMPKAVAYNRQCPELEVNLDMLAPRTRSNVGSSSLGDIGPQILEHPSKPPLLSCDAITTRPFRRKGFLPVEEAAAVSERRLQGEKVQAGCPDLFPGNEVAAPGSFARLKQ